ncbi:hypothetical protein HDV00_007313 [Rhizophlyctis rosea]|nr:hypothetical protein HDV00_007313 [Rhizophlyctis rosea]
MKKERTKDGQHLDPNKCDRCTFLFKICTKPADAPDGIPCRSCQTANKPCYTSTSHTVFGDFFEGRAVPPAFQKTTRHKSSTIQIHGRAYREKSRVETAAAGFDRLSGKPYLRPGTGRIVPAAQYTSDIGSKRSSKRMKQFLELWEQRGVKQEVQDELEERETQPPEEEEDDVDDKTTKRRKTTSPDVDDEDANGTEKAEGVSLTEPVPTIHNMPADRLQLPSPDLLDAIHSYASKRFADRGYEADFWMSGDSLVALGILLEEYLRDLTPEQRGK